MDAFTGEIRVFAFEYPPQDWAFCDGASIPASQHQRLAAIIHGAYGRDGSGSFRLPDLRGMAVMGVGSHEGQSVARGETLGEASITLTGLDLPSHTHHAVGYQALSQGTPGPVSNAYISLPRSGATVYDAWTTRSAASTTKTTLSPLTLGSAGGTPAGAADAHDNVSPFLAMNFCICLQGFPAAPKPP